MSDPSLLHSLKFLPLDIALDDGQKKVLRQIEGILLSYDSKKGLFSFLKSNNTKSGIYLQGSVGSGKTMLMELCKSLTKKPVELIHYQDFVQNLHKDIHKLGGQDKSRILQTIAKNYAKNINYLFLDEFEIKDITDAMIMGPLFREMINNKIFIFLTTNTEPDNLYKDGLQRESFLPFIAMIKKEFELIKLESGHDYRLDYKSPKNSREDHIFYPINEQNQRKIDDIINHLTAGNKLLPCDIEVFGRKISFRETYNSGNEKDKIKILVTDFDELFNRDMSYIDYINICKSFSIIIIKQVKTIDSANTNLAVRFINFIDNAYFYKVVLYINLATTPEQLYQNGARQNEFKRTISRLFEMSHAQY